MIRIVVVEDELLVKKGMILTTDWQKYDCEVVGEASNGLEGMDVICRAKPDIVITDVKMPGLDGIKMIENLKEGGIKPEFVIITGYGEFEYARKAVKLGVRDFLVKPIDDEDLDSALQNACEAVRHKRTMEKIQNSLENMEDSRIMLFKEYIEDRYTDDDYVARAVRHISRDYRKEITVKTVADSMFISESYLSRLFKLKVGQTFGSYLAYYRIKKACELLREADVKIYEIANMIGYKDQRYFSLIFKRLAGVTPKEFRDKLNRHMQ